MRSGSRIATALATLFCISLLATATAGAQEAPSTLDEIYAALRPENLRTPTGRTAYSQGESVEFLFDLVNTSDQPLVVPLTDFFGTSFHLVGTEQSWLERLGPDSTIPSIPPIIGRKGTWYAAGGAIIAVEGLPSNTIPAGGRVTRGAAIFYPTGGFPTGRYRFHVEYKPLLGGLFDVIAEVSLDLTFGDVPSDETPPVITVPSSVVMNATSPDGVAVSFGATAVDDVDGPVAVDCSPQSGNIFPIGTTQVTCTASDAAGNEASASLDVHVKAASQQLDDLIARVYGLGPGTSLADKLTEAKAVFAAGDSVGACEKLNAFASASQAQSGKRLTPEQSEELVASADRIRAVLDC